MGLSARASVGSSLVVATTENLIRTALRLSWFTIIYNILEGIVAISLGVHEGSMALAGFGGDSLIEVGSAILILWRLRGGSDKEWKASFGIGILFMLLAAITLFSSVIQIISETSPNTTIPGVFISLVSLTFMFFLWNAKLKVGRALQSEAIMNDAACSLACIKLSFTLLLGSAIYWMYPALWWVDSLAALILVYFIAREGIQILKTSRQGRSVCC